jgi:hypothetical protein
MGEYIKIDLREIGLIDWSHLAQDSDQRWGLMNAEINPHVP